MRSLYASIDACRACGGDHLETVLDLGSTPLADRLIRPENVGEPEPIVPLSLVFCRDCALVQIRETVDPAVLFCEDYPYYSSVSPQLLRHFGESAERIVAEFGLSANSLVIEAASNDGYMLKTFAEAGIPVLGIDPAAGPAREANRRGVETLNTFFTRNLAQQLREDGRRADVFLANNVLAHVEDLNGFVEGIALLLKDNGVAVIECPYLLDLIDHNEFDTIYHQHLCYFSVTSLDRLFHRHGLSLNRVQRTTIHGGSLRLFVARDPKYRDDSVTALLEAEASQGTDKVDYFLGFAEKVKRVKHDLLRELERLKRTGARIAGYGAAAKACTLLGYCEIDGGQLEWIADLNERKHGRLMGGNHLRIVPPSNLLDQMPEYCLILAWNFAEEIMSQQAEYREAGGRFIVPIPELKVVA